MKRWKELLLVTLTAVCGFFGYKVAADFYDWRYYYEVNHSDRYNGYWTYFSGWIIQGAYIGPWYQERMVWYQSTTNSDTNYWTAWPAFAGHNLAWNYGGNNMGSCNEKSKWAVQNVGSPGDWRYLYLQGHYFAADKDHYNNGSGLFYYSLYDSSYVSSNTTLIYNGPASGDYVANEAAYISLTR
jgi:hypothetical protein